MLKKLYLPGNISNEEKIKTVMNLFDRANVKQSAKTEIQLFHNKALHHLSKINVGEENKKTLLDFCESLMIREI